ncbi:MAG: glycosyltransferase [Limnothrix sp. RL_2_0]|nr:glycosyltransferase [Limnothrix sp. RL_2_0]
MRLKKPLQIITRYEFIPDSEVHAYFQIADVVLALYLRHIGMSGILLLAAESGTPVLSTDYGLMGEIVRQYKLGATVNSGNPIEIAQKFRQIVSTDLFTDGFNPVVAKQLVEGNSVEKFADIFFREQFSSA